MCSLSHSRLPNQFVPANCRYDSPITIRAGTSDAPFTFIHAHRRPALTVVGNEAVSHWRLMAIY